MLVSRMNEQLFTLPFVSPTDGSVLSFGATHIPLIKSQSSDATRQRCGQMTSALTSGPEVKISHYMYNGNANIFPKGAILCIKKALIVCVLCYSALIF